MKEMRSSSLKINQPTQTPIERFDTVGVTIGEVLAGEIPIYLAEGDLLIQGLDVKSDTGSATITLKIGVTAITGLSSNSVSTTINSYEATGNNTMTTNDQLRLEIVSATSCTNLNAKVRYLIVNP